MQTFQKGIYPVLSSQDLKTLDLEATKRYALSPETLMEDAGLLMAQKILELYTRGDMRVILLIGPGNNGGDGLVIARHLFHHGWDVLLLIIGDESLFRYPALNNLKVVKALNIARETVPDLESWVHAKKSLESCDLLIDALIGIGAQGAMRPLQKAVIQSVNALDLPVVSVDVPSGLLNEEDQVSECLIYARHTLTVAVPKISMFQYPEKDACGEVHLIDLPFPKTLTSYKNYRSYLITDALCVPYIPKRPADAHKGVFGHLLIVGGSRAFCGAVVLACLAALKTGSGKVTLASIPVCCAAVRACAPEVMTVELPENQCGQIAQEACSELLPLDPYSAVAYGMGVGADDNHNIFLAELLKACPKPIVLDADALNNLALVLGERSQVQKADLCLDSRVLLTPHVLEASRLFGLEKKYFVARKHFFVRAFMQKYGVNVLVKDAVSLAAFVDNSFYYSSKGNVGMATAGSGDVLSGIIASFCAQTANLVRSTVLGVHLHGAAGDSARKLLPAHALLASDIVQAIPEILYSWEHATHNPPNTRHP